MKMIAWLILISGLLGASTVCCSAGHYVVAFERQLPAWENGSPTGCLGNHNALIWVWDETGQPLSNISLRTSAGTVMGTTDADGRCEIPISKDNDFDLTCHDASGSTSEASRLLTTNRPECWGHYSFEIGFLFKMSASNPGTFDRELNGTWNEAMPDPATIDNDVPYTRSLAYNSVDVSDYWSDDSTWGNWQNPPSYFGQTFVATGNRVVAARVHGIIANNGWLDWQLRIVTFPDLQPIGPDSSVPLRYPSGWEAFWGVNDCPVIPGRTYMLQVWRNDGGMNAYHIKKNVYSQGMYYEGTMAYSQYDLNGHIVCMNYESGKSPDVSGDGLVNLADVAVLRENWHTSASEVDIAPWPAGDGVVDFQDLAALAQSWLEDLLAVACWKLDEGAGTIAHDSAGEAHGTIHGNPQWIVQGRINGALQFDGLDDYIEAPFIFDPSAGPFSAYAWARGGGPNQIILSQADGDGVGGNWLSTDSLGRLMTTLRAPGRTSPILLSDTVVTDGQWHHLGLTWDGAFRTLYVDGSPIKQDTSPQTSLNSANGPMFIASYPIPALLWTGSLDEITLYDTEVQR